MGKALVSEEHRNLYRKISSCISIHTDRSKNKHNKKFLQQYGKRKNHPNSSSCSDTKFISST